MVQFHGIQSKFRFCGSEYRVLLSCFSFVIPPAICEKVARVTMVCSSEKFSQEKLVVHLADYKNASCFGGFYASTVQQVPF